MFTQEELAILNQAREILASKVLTSDVFTTPHHTRLFCQTAIAHLEYEVFGVLFLNNRNRLIKFVELFRGTVDGASVYPREVAKEALMHNAAAVIFTHNHPSGVAEPSQADIQITTKLVAALGLLDIRVLDHIVVGLNETTSLAERGYL